MEALHPSLGSVKRRGNPLELAIMSNRVPKCVLAGSPARGLDDFLETCSRLGRRQIDLEPSGFPWRDKRFPG